MWMAAQIQGMPGQPFSPGFFPGLVGAFAVLCGATLILRAAGGRAPHIEEDEEAAGPPLRAAAAWVLGGIAVMVLLLETVGFLPLALLWLLGFQLLLGVRVLPALVLSVLLVAATYQAFTHLLGVPLPPGEWLIELGL